MSEVTVVCCYNNLDIYNNFVNSLNSQSCSYELIGIDNRDNKAFKSCSKAYNSVSNQAKTKYIVYSHQDILFNEPDSLTKFIGYLYRINVDDILGVAGVKMNLPGRIFTDTKYRHPDGRVEYIGDDRIEGGMMECDTVDECFFGGYTDHFINYPFDETVCYDWHFYAVEACLCTRSKLLRGGGA